MKRNIIICGLIAGLIVTALMMAAMAKIDSLNNYAGSMLVGYTSMLVAFSLIFVAIKNARDKYGNGTITFGKAFRIGLVITLIASTMYVVVWMIDYYYFIPDFFQKYAARQLREMKAAGATSAQLAAKQIQTMQYGEMYKNPFFNAMFTYMEILPVGLIVSVLAAVILKRSSTADRVVLTN
jgi:hypothetical protein